MLTKELMAWPMADEAQMKQHEVFQDAPHEVVLNFNWVAFCHFGNS